MPVYEFSCSNGCENYEVWRRIDERENNTDCPRCDGKGMRVFSPPMMLSGSLRLRQSSSEPQRIRKESGSGQGKPRLRESTTRPWMLNRGC